MIVKPVSRLVQELDAKSVTVLGCTCHTGIGAETMRAFRSGLAGAEGDFIAVVGDISPVGRDPYYHTMAAFVDAYSSKPVHVLRSNHDGPDFQEYFGHANRAVLSEEFAFVMLDNSERRFSGETLNFLRETMAIVECRNVIVAFHVPPPNRISGNSMSGEEWTRFEDALGVWRNRVSFLLCGHDHCYYEDDVDGLRLVVAGGGTKSLPIERTVQREPYALEISFDGDGDPLFKTRALNTALPDHHSDDVHAALTRAYDSQCRNLVTLRLNAEDALAAGNGELAHFYRAAAESGLRQVRLLHHLLKGRGFAPSDAAAMLGEPAALPVGLSAEYSENLLAGYALQRLDDTQRNTVALLDRFHGDPDARPAEGYSLCTACAMLFPGREAPNYCPACGAPYHAIREVK